MKQVFIKKGKAISTIVPEPIIKKGFVKIAVEYSTISAGTEMSTLKGSEKGIFQKIIEDPSKVTKVIDILKNQGLKNAKNKVHSSTDKFNSIGYSISGRVIEVGEDVDNFKIGERVSAGGSGYALHAGVVSVPKNLVVNIPEGLDMCFASTGTVGSIALHGVRRADLRIGEFGVVVGNGLIGLITLQILKASGVKVCCIDINSERLKLAQEIGADIIVNPATEDPTNAISCWTNGYGADAVLFTASTNDNAALSQSFNMCRKRGRVVMVGVSGMNINREDIYKNEIDFLISTSYGPGRYDDNYELKGNDYPYPYVRWTENRNISEYLNLLISNKVQLEKLIPKVYPIDNADSAYNNIQDNPNDHILTILKFNDTDIHQTIKRPPTYTNQPKTTNNIITIGLIGAGSFASNTLLPIIYQMQDKFKLKSIANNSGDKSLNVAAQFKADYITNNIDEIINDPGINLIMICTRHDDHAELVLKCLKAGKNVYVEKPLATSIKELETIEAFYQSSDQAIVKPFLTVGFNRRFSKSALLIRDHLKNKLSPTFIHYRMNAGFIDEDSWVHENGGRITGEACHIIDLMQFLTDSEIESCSVSSIKPSYGKFSARDNRSITIEFNDGSIAIIDYFSCGSKLLEKEYMEVHFDNKSIIMNDYKSVIGYGLNVKFSSSVPEKGHKEEWCKIYESIINGTIPIPLNSIFDTTRTSILASK